MPRAVIDPAVPDRSTTRSRLRDLDVGELRSRWQNVFGRRPHPHLPRHLLFRVLAYRLQADVLGDLDGESQRLLVVYILFGVDFCEHYHTESETRSADHAII